MATTSSVYAAGWRALYRILSEATLPDDMVTTVGLGPDGQPHKGLFFAGFPKAAEPKEYVMIGGQIAEAQLDMEETFGEPVHQEIIPFVIGIQTARSDKTQWQALDRLEELTAIVEDALDAVDVIALAPDELGPFQGRWQRSGFDGRFISPLPDGGYMGQANVRLNVLATRR